MSYLAVALAACMWGTWRFVLLFAEQQVPAQTLDARVESAIVMLVITLFAFVLFAFEKKETRARNAKRNARDWIGVAWLGIADALNVFLLFAAYAHTTVAIAVTTHYLAPIFVAAVAPRLLGERARTTSFFSLDTIAVVVGVIGLALLLRPWSGELSARDWIGAAAGAGSAVFYASNVIVNKSLVGKFTAIELMAFHGVVATPFLFALAPFHAFGELNARATIILIVGGIGPGALGGILFIWALRRVRAARASTITLLEPLVAVVIAIVWYRERLAALSWLGASLILVSAASVMRKA